VNLWRFVAVLLLSNKEQQQNNALVSFVTFWVCRRRSGHEWTASSSLHHTRIVKLGSFGFAVSFLRKSAWNCFHLFATIRAWLIIQQCNTQDATPKGDTTMCFWSSRYHLCMGSHYWIKDRSRRNYVWLTASNDCPNINYFSTVHTIKYTHQWSI